MTPVTGPGPDAAAEDSSAHYWDVPGVVAAEHTRITAEAGRCTVVVGANGVGKSALGMWMEQHGRDASRR
jgi:ABC-type cobalamin/Fe3+-siderophores transport system ATPase subunit